MTLTLKSGKMEDKDYRRCQQVKCGFYQEGSCRRCESCSSESYILKKSCSVCYSCENVPGALRWGDNNPEDVVIVQLEEEQTEAPKEPELEEELTA